MTDEYTVISPEIITYNSKNRKSADELIKEADSKMY